jgi:hypothetical protein
MDYAVPLEYTILAGSIIVMVVLIWNAVGKRRLASDAYDRNDYRNR